MKKKISKIIVTLSLLIITSCSELLPTECEKMNAIANDLNKMEYLDKWIRQNISSVDFLKLMGKSGVVRMIDAPKKIEKLGINWKMLGFDNNYVSVKLNRKIVDVDKLLDFSKINSISFGDGRNSIVILVNNSSVLGIDGVENFKENVSKISKRVFLICN